MIAQLLLEWSHHHALVSQARPTPAREEVGLVEVGLACETNHAHALLVGTTIKYAMGDNV